LSEEIRQRGALVSGFPLELPRDRRIFRSGTHHRGLEPRTLVVEAARSSGSLITARQAASYGREVFAIPGSIYSPLSAAATN